MGFEFWDRRDRIDIWDLGSGIWDLGFDLGIRLWLSAAALANRDLGFGIYSFGIIFL